MKVAENKCDSIIELLS